MSTSDGQSPVLDMLAMSVMLCSPTTGSVYISAYSCSALGRRWNNQNETAWTVEF